MLLLNLQKKSTKLVSSFNFKSSCRFMETEVQNNNSIRTSNAFLDYYRTHDDSYLPEVQQISDYLLQGLENQKTFSEMAGESSQILGYHIDGESFVAFIEGTRGMLLRKAGPDSLRDFDAGLVNMDDLHLYEDSTGKLELCPQYKEIYTGYMEAIYYPSIPEEYKTQNISSSASDTASDSSASDSTSDSYYNITVETSSDTSNTSLENDLVSNNNLTIAILTLTAFIVIQLLVQFDSWYQRKYNKDVSVVEDKQDPNNNDTLLHSVSENIIFHTISFKLLLFFIPFSFILLFSLRYYYFFKLRKFFKL